MIVSYVILHYLAVNDTIECVESILNNVDFANNEVNIIIVDNGSYNDSFVELNQYFSKTTRVGLLKSDKNLGFAKGNNIGYRYAKEELKSDFIILLNNDTIINQTDFTDVLVKQYCEYDYAVLGPDIITKDGCHQNPGKEINWTYRKLMLFRVKKTAQIFFSYIPLINTCLTINESAFLKEKINNVEFDVLLHGACLIFSPRYVKKFDGLFDGTFLYMEEDILRLQMKHYGMLMMYTPELTVFHKEDVATNMSISKSINRKRNFYKNLLKSAKIYTVLKRQYGEDNHNEIDNRISCTKNTGK